ncbi:MAG TPA: cyclohexanone monooxygenase, partial [Acidimicrobiales bacterium]|nr:cyclohexanone monooxygenase [Acidimicrobiales bacterium]
EPILELTPGGLTTRASRYELDALVFATGYDAVTGAVLAVDVRGRDGVELRDRWVGGPRAYLGVAVAGFPNLFFITGPGSPSIVSNVVLSIEQHVDWIGACVEDLRSHDHQSIEATEEAETEWMHHVEALASKTLFPTADSFYVGANIPGKPRVFMAYLGGVGAYRARCDEVAASSYVGFVTREMAGGTDRVPA